MTASHLAIPCEDTDDDDFQDDALLSRGRWRSNGPVAEAQIGGLIKKKVAEAVKGPEKTEAKPADGEKKSIYNDEIVEMTGPVLDGFANGLRTEIALRNEFREVLAKLKTPAQYESCTNDAAASPEGQKISTRICPFQSRCPRRMQRVIAKVSQDLVPSGEEVRQGPGGGVV
jgi:hypothetical protein